MNPPLSPESGSDLMEVDVERGNRELMQREALTGSGLGRMGLMLNMQKSAEGLPGLASAESATHVQRDRLLQIAQDVRTLGETPLSKEAMVAAVSQIATPKRLKAHSENAQGVALLHRGGETHIFLQGISWTDNRGDEQKALQEIQKRLSQTVSGFAKNYTAARSYLKLDPRDGLYKINRALIEADLRWLHDDKRTGPNATPKRIALFQGYATLLEEICNLNNRKDEEAYRKQYKSVLSDQRTLETFCRDPNAVKGAGKFALLIAAGVLLSLWAIKDIRKKTFSFATLILLGAVMFLAQGGSKFSFLTSEQFGKATRERFNGDAMKRLQWLSKTKPQAYSHLMRVVKLYEATGIPAEKIDLLTNPKKWQRGADRQRTEVANHSVAVPDDIARLFVGMPGNHHTLLNGVRSTARTQDRSIVSDFAEANYTSKGAVQEELSSMSRTPTLTESIAPITPDTYHQNN